MSKRVHITYSVEFDKVLETIKDLVDKTYHSEFRKLDEKFNLLSTSLEKESEKQALQTIEEIRQKLMSIDFCLDDCHKIIAGYQKTQIAGEENDVDSGR